MSEGKTNPQSSCFRAERISCNFLTVTTDSAEKQLRTAGVKVEEELPSPPARGLPTGDLQSDTELLLSPGASLLSMAESDPKQGGAKFSPHQAGCESTSAHSEDTRAELHPSRGVCSAGKADPVA